MSSYKFLAGSALLFILMVHAGAQSLQPARWKVSLSSDHPGNGEVISVLFEVEIAEDWYLYSSDFDPDLGPMVTSFVFLPNASYSLVGEIQAVNAQKKYDSLWGGEYTYFKHTGSFVQKLKVEDSAELHVEGHYSYQVCSDIQGKCIPFQEAFSL